MLVPSFLVTTLLALEGAEAQGRKVPKYGPAYNSININM